MATGVTIMRCLDGLGPLALARPAAISGYY
jgi:hypothetical protein